MSASVMACVDSGIAAMPTNASVGKDFFMDGLVEIALEFVAHGELQFVFVSRHADGAGEKATERFEAAQATGRGNLPGTGERRKRVRGPRVVELLRTLSG